MRSRRRSGRAWSRCWRPTSCLRPGGGRGGGSGDEAGASLRPSPAVPPGVPRSLEGWCRVANIATVATAAVVRTGSPRRVTPRALVRAMTRFHGRSYCVPVWGFDDCPRGTAYGQHGEKWSPTGVTLAWERYGRDLDAIW